MTGMMVKGADLSTKVLPTLEPQHDAYRIRSPIFHGGLKLAVKR